MKFSFLVWIALTALAIGARAADKGNSVWTPELSFDEIQAKAKAGDPYFQAVLGIYLRAGESGVKIDFDAARFWSQKAADGGDPLGFYNLGNISLLRKQLKEATDYYQEAQLLLTRKAAEGDPIAQFAMGEICWMVVPKNRFKALEYWHDSAAAGYSQAQATLGAIYLKGSPGILEKDERRGIFLLEMACRAKSMTAYLNLGLAYYNGEGVRKSKELAAGWLRKASQQNFSDAQYLLATLLSEVDPTKNKAEIIRLLQKAADQDHLDAKKDLQSLLGGTAVASTPTTPPKPKVNPPNASSEQLGQAQDYNLAGKRNFQERNYTRAFAYFKKAAELGNPEAQRFTGLMLFQGKGCAKDRSLAGQWLRKAASQGDTEAQKILKSFARLFPE